MNKCYLIDCMEFMKDKPDDYYDLAIVNPPYGIGNWTMEARKDRPYNKKWDISWNQNPPGKDYFLELFRISKDQIIWGANYYREYIPSGGAIVWDKGNRSGIGSGCEIASCSKIKMVAYYFYQHTGFITKEKDRIHPCQKPIALYKWLLTKYAKPGYKLLDTHSGSGSFRIAAYDMGFDLDSCELDKDYFDANEKRYQNHILQQDLFGKEEYQEIIYKDDNENT